MFKDIVITKKEQQREMRENKRYNYTPQPNGRSYYYIVCPYCEATTKAYIWSLHGGGKKCNCGALHSTFGTFEPKK